MPRSEEQNKVGIIGLGNFGRSLALALVESGCHVLGVDRDAILVQRLPVKIPSVVLDATDEDALGETGIVSCNTVVVAIGNDFESNVMTTVALKNLGIRHIVCVSRTEHERKILLRVGADRVIEPEVEAGRRLAVELMLPDSLEQMPLGSSHHVVTLQVSPFLAGQRLAEIGLLDRGQEVTVLAIQRGDKSIVWLAADTVLLEGDLLVILQSTGANFNFLDLS